MTTPTIPPPPPESAFPTCSVTFAELQTIHAMDPSHPLVRGYLHGLHECHSYCTNRADARPEEELILTDIANDIQTRIFQLQGST